MGERLTQSDLFNLCGGIQGAYTLEDDELWSEAEGEEGYKVCEFHPRTPHGDKRLLRAAHDLLLDLLDARADLADTRRATRDLRPVWPILPDGTGFCVECGVVWPEFGRFCPECGVPVLGEAVEKLRERGRSVVPEGTLPLVDGLPPTPPPSKPLPPWLAPPPVPEPSPWTPAPPLAEARACGKCGLKLEPVMGYVCHNHPCPVGLGGPWCGVDRG